MNSRASFAAILGFFLLFSAASAFNITKLLGESSDFSSFNDFLTQTKLADEINSRATITILAVSNGDVSALSGKPLDVVKRILSAHVILDYYDEKKLNKMSTKNSTLLTTLFQTSGTAVNQEGFVKVALINEGEVAFGSAVNGAPINAKLVKSVISQPYNISVLQISTVIQIPGIDAKQTPPSQTPAPKSSPAKSPSPAKADTPVANAPKAEAPKADTPKAETPKAETPKAESPAAGDAPVSSPPKPSDDDQSDAPSPGPSASGASSLGFVGVAAGFGLISSLLAL